MGRGVVWEVSIENLILLLCCETVNSLFTCPPQSVASRSLTLRREGNGSDWEGAKKKSQEDQKRHIKEKEHIFRLSQERTQEEKEPIRSIEELSED